jgi:hypothetical protein
MKLAKEGLSLRLLLLSIAYYDLRSESLIMPCAMELHLS